MILSSVLFLLCLGLVAAGLLAVASRLLAVYEDPRIAEVEAALLGANCGGCGHPGCHAAAEAVVAGRAGAGVCVAGGPDIASAVAKVMGVRLLLQEPRIADHYCHGGDRAENRYLYEGARDCRAQAMLHGGKLLCNVGCLGCGTCVDNCPFDALSMGPTGVPVVDPAKCRACGKCAEICPKGVISVFDNTRRILHMNKPYECLAPCRQICPAQINIPRYIEQIRNKDYAGAVSTLKERNPLILTCGRVCPAPCESYCRRALVDDPVGINYLKRFVADWEMARGERVPVQIAPDTGRKVAVVGGGPAGLSCAYFLRRLGHAVVIFESMPELGGQLRYGIPEYRLPKKALDWEIEGVTSLGVEVRTRVQFGRDITLDGLRDQGFDAVFLGMGAWRNYSLRIENEEARGVIGGTEYLTRAGLGVQMGLARQVVVVGGGNTAIDAARTARRRNAEVTIMYRRTRKEMPANQAEIEAAEAEGVRLLFLAAPRRVVMDESGHAQGLEYLRMELGEPDASGRRRPVPVEGSESVLACNQIVTAIGQFPDTSYLENYAEHIGDQQWACKITPRKTLAVNEETMQTAIPHVFAAGDYVTGPALVVMAVGGGRRAARGIHYFLMEKDAPASIRGRTAPLPETLFTELHGVGRKARTQQPELCVDDRVCNFREVEQTISEDQARAEAGRCLRCGSTCYDRDLLDELPAELRARLNHGRAPA